MQEPIRLPRLRRKKGTLSLAQDPVDRMLKLAEQGKLGGTLKGSRPEGQDVPRPFGSSLSEQGSQQQNPPPKSHKPSGVSLSPKGDIGAANQRELRAAFPRRIKNSGPDYSNPLTYRKPSVANDYGDKGSTL